MVSESKFVYLSMLVRTGKTLTAMGVAEKLNVSRVLFVTKKKAISSIEDDYNKLNPPYDIVIINYESLHKIQGKFDLIVLDEAHRMGAYPKPSKRAKQVRDCLLYTSPSPRDRTRSRMPSSA